MDKLDLVSRCKLPIALKSSICKAIENHSFNCHMNLNLDLNAISSLPENLLKPFTALLQHASHIDSSSKELVLEIIKVLTEYSYSDDDADKSPELNSSNATSANRSDKYSEKHASDIDEPIGASDTFYAYLYFYNSCLHVLLLNITFLCKNLY